MAEAHLDHPGEIRWWPRQGPAAVLGPCPHDCPHHTQATIAHGPDLRRYVLVRCDVPDGCNGQCRAWAPDGPQASTPWLMVATPPRSKVY